MTAIAFESWILAAGAISGYLDLEVGPSAGGEGERAAGNLGWFVHVGAISGQQPVRAARPDLHRPVIGVGDPDPDPLTRASRHMQILGLAVDGVHAAVRVGERRHIQRLGDA